MVLNAWWPSDQVTKWPSDLVTEWPSDQVTKWQSDRMTEWPSDQMTEKWPGYQLWSSQYYYWGIITLVNKIFIDIAVNEYQSFAPLNCKINYFGKANGIEMMMIVMMLMVRVMVMFLSRKIIFVWFFFVLVLLSAHIKRFNGLPCAEFRLFTSWRTTYFE